MVWRRNAEAAGFPRLLEAGGTAVPPAACALADAGLAPLLSAGRPGPAGGFPFFAGRRAAAAALRAWAWLSSARSWPAAALAAFSW